MTSVPCGCVAIRRYSSRAGFTLIELLVVVAIIAMLLALAGQSLRGTVDRYHLRQAQQTLEMCDAKARRWARTNEASITVRIDRVKRSIELGDSTFRISKAVEIKGVTLGKRAGVERRTEIEFHPDGWSPSYAIELSRGSMTRWMVVLGESGQVVDVLDRGAANALLRP